MVWSAMATPNLFICVIISMFVRTALSARPWRHHLYLLSIAINDNAQAVWLHEARTADLPSMIGE